VLGHAELGPRLQQQAVSHMAGTVLTNYTISFDQAARARAAMPRPTATTAC
jgi:hypothetical protein